MNVHIKVEDYMKLMDINAELKAQLAALQWQEITESNLPTGNDETYSTKHGCVTGPAFSERSFEWWTKEREWTHFRPIGAPDASKR
jgi:hypothetical protein